MGAWSRQLSLFDASEEFISPCPPLKKSNRVRTQPDSGEPVVNGFAALLHGAYAHIEIIVKPRMWNAWRAQWNGKTCQVRLEIPALLAEAPTEVKQSLLEWALLVARPKPRKSRGSLGNTQDTLKTERARLESLIRKHLAQPGGEASTAAQVRASQRNGRRILRLQEKGRHQDLTASFQRVNADYFQGTLEARVTWSARTGGLSTHSVVEDAKGEAYHLITISRGYDHASVTPEILDGVMYHECLHIAVPPETRNGRRVVHGRAFRLRERQYRHYSLWTTWHRHELPKIIWNLKRAAKRKPDRLK